MKGTLRRGRGCVLPCQPECLHGWLGLAIEAKSACSAVRGVWGFYEQNLRWTRVSTSKWERGVSGVGVGECSVPPHFRGFHTKIFPSGVSIDHRLRTKCWWCLLVLGTLEEAPSVVV